MALVYVWGFERPNVIAFTGSRRKFPITPSQYIDRFGSIAVPESAEPGTRSGVKTSDEVSIDSTQTGGEWLLRYEEDAE